MNITRRLLLTGTLGVFAGLASERSSLAQTGSATPEGDPTLTGGPERMHSLLAMLPESFSERTAADGVIFYYADLKRQLDSLEIPSYSPDDEELPSGFTGAAVVLATASIAFQYALEPEFFSTFGFSAFQAEESLMIGNPPNDLTIFRGGLPIDELPGVWEASGYFLETSESGVDIWTAGKEGEVDLTTNVSRYGVGALNNVAIFGDTIVFGRYFADVEAVANQVTEPEASIADHAELVDILATLADDTVSAIAVTSQFLDAYSLMLPEVIEQQSALFEESEAVAGVFPEPRTAVFAITAGAAAPDFVATGEGTPDVQATAVSGDSDGGIVQVRLLCNSDEEAAIAVTAIEYRWNEWASARNLEPFTELMTIVSAEPHPIQQSVATVDFREVRGSGVWINMVLARDLLPFAWIGEEPVEATPTAAG